MPEDMAAFFTHLILRGVSFMHEKAYCHRDLKPENCMVERKTQNLKIIDFGLSKHLDLANTLGHSPLDRVRSCAECLPF